ncbi:MAG: DNA repair exonuclease [Lachnospiraceae bacterium]|nr:DNA repair exonuclease [Lachnospiraceae bacterium]
MKFIHCADLHLDSKMESNLSGEDARLRREELLDTFSGMVGYASENNITAILIAGDLFDKVHIRKHAKQRVWEEINGHPEIDFIYLQGNHDRSDFLDIEGPYPDNLKLFSGEEWISYSYGDVVITGREITDNNYKTLGANLVLDSTNCNIVMLHGQESEYEGSDKTYVVNLPEFRDKGIDYLALGHIHSYKLDRLDDRGVYCYSGALEGRGFDEVGPKGFVVLDVEDKKISVTFIQFAKRLIHEVVVEVDPEDDMASILEKIKTYTEMYPERDLTKVIITGHRSMDLDIDLPRIKRNFENRFFLFKVCDETRVEINYEQYANDRSLKGAFVRLMENKDIPDEDRDRIIEIGMKALMGEEFTD